MSIFRIIMIALLFHIFALVALITRILGEPGEGKRMNIIKKILYTPLIPLLALYYYLRPRIIYQIEGVMTYWEWLKKCFVYIWFEEEE